MSRRLIFEIIKEIQMDGGLSPSVIVKMRGPKPPLKPKPKFSSGKIKCFINNNDLIGNCRDKNSAKSPRANKAKFFNSNGTISAIGYKPQSKRDYNIKTSFYFYPDLEPSPKMRLICPASSHLPIDCLFLCTIPKHAHSRHKRTLECTKEILCTFIQQCSSIHLYLYSHHDSFPNKNPW